MNFRNVNIRIYSSSLSYCSNSP